MPVSRLASESDIQGTDILTTAAATLIRTTGATDHTTMVGRHFIGIADTECTTRVDITVTTATGGKINGEKFSRAGGVQYPASLFLWRH
jgi:hypothetical protein